MDTDALALPGMSLPPPPFGAQRMYAIAFDLDTDSLRKHYPQPSFNNAYADVRETLQSHGFEWQQGSVTCVLAIQDLSQRHGWFAQCVRDVRMLRIEENDDLSPSL